MVLYSSSSKTLFALLAATFIGCSNSSPPTDTDTHSGNSGLSTHSTEKSAHPPTAGEPSSHKSLELTDDFTVWNESNAAEANIPASIPVYPDAIPNLGMSAGGFFTMYWKTTGERSKVMEFYQNALVDAGWNVTSDLAHGHFDAEQSGNTLKIFIVGTNQPMLIIAQLSQQEGRTKR
jgi:hypothetical protein